MQLKPINEVIIFKIHLKKNAGIIITPDQGKDTVRKWQIEKAEVYAIGDKVETVKVGDVVDVVNRAFLQLDIEKHLGEKTTEEIVYVRGKAEDINFIIE